MMIFTLSFIILYLPVYIESQCSSDWSTNVGIDGNTYGYKVIISDMVNFFEAQDRCIAQGSHVASIHSDAENNFVGALAANLLDQCQNNNSVCAQRVSRNTADSLRLDRLLRSLWIGMHRVQYSPWYNGTVDCINSDGTDCDYGGFNGISDSNRNVTPWSKGNPSGSDEANGAGGPEDCVEMHAPGVWNDIGCYHKLGGVICKKNCTSTICPSKTTLAPSTSSFSTKLSTTTKAATTAKSSGGGYICGSDDWPWKLNNKTGKAHAYKLFNSTGTYWQLHDKCYDSCASPCSIETPEENQYILQNVFSNVVTNLIVGRRKRATDSTCIYTGIHRFMPNPPNGPIGCSCDDGGSCDYGNGDTIINTTTTSLNSTTKASTITTSKPSSTSTSKSTTGTPIRTSTLSPNSPWAPGCPSTSSTGLGDTDGYGTKNCVGLDSKGKWKDQACERPGSGIICKKPCIPPAGS